MTRQNIFRAAVILLCALIILITVGCTPEEEQQWDQLLNPPTTTTMTIELPSHELFPEIIITQRELEPLPSFVGCTAITLCW